MFWFRIIDLIEKVVTGSSSNSLGGLCWQKGQEYGEVGRKGRRAMDDEGEVSQLGLD